MDRSLQALGVVERLFSQILSGERTSTIRWRERRIMLGPLTFVCDGRSDKTALVEVVRCTEMPLHQAAAFVNRMEEWPDEVMLEGMREHYPAIQLSSIVQIIEFSLSRAD